MRHMIFVVLVSMAIVSCATAPKRDLYTLDMRSSGGVEAAVDIAVGGVVVSEKLARRTIVIQASPTRVESYATARWAFGLREMIEQKLAAELDAAAGGRPLVLDAVVEAFEQVDTAAGPAARVRMRVEMRDRDSNRSEPPLVAKVYEATRPATEKTVDGVVQALSRTLEEIAFEIAEDAAAL